ncbi:MULTISPECIES: peptide-methionine (S)-S-oxide reductase MsrA [Hyphobacterium]|uniref:Peptide methionine sulfoxide reductase MsrA n=1 Tax=Hyphobacterium vulgare TaxID=1736751 RepID=A0ABV6ZVL3_9PROT
MAWFDKTWKSELVPASEALKGRETPLPLEGRHFVNGHALKDVPPGHEVAVFGLGCFWGAERLFWTEDGVWSTSVGYAGGITPNPTYEETCTGATGHAEVVRIVFDPSVISYGTLLKLFWENHDPTQGMRQGGDVGTQYRSAIYWMSEDQRIEAEASAQAYDAALKAAGRGGVTTEIAKAGPFYFAEDYHQQYLAKNPGGYCGLGGTGVVCPIGLGVSSS